MFLTRSIRRLMGLWLIAICSLLCLMFASSLRSLWSYDKAVDDLDFSINQVPRKAEIVATIGPLFEPLIKVPSGPQGAIDRHLQFEARLEEGRESIRTFLKRLSNLPNRPEVEAQSHFIYPILSSIDNGFMRLEALSGQLAMSPGDEKLVQRMLQTVAVIQTDAMRMPDPNTNLNDILQRSRGEYATLFWWVTGAGLSIVVLLFGLAWFTREWITTPIRELHRGACRIAQGSNYDYRLELPKGREMTELAEAFNLMTCRFQETKEGLDEQVEVRSKLLVRSERLADVGILSAGVAHEINNPLSAIVMAADSLQERILMTGESLDETDRQVALEYLEMIQGEASRCKGITTQLLDFSRGQDTTRSDHDLATIVREVLALVSHMSKFRDREIVFERDNPCYVEVNGPEIKQVVLNLVLNGLEAMDPGGRMQIDIADETDEVVLVIVDDGCGMAPDVQARLFDPFFTQRKGGRGTGLGLSITHRIIVDHGGTIAPHSDGEGEGSTFRIRLPRRAKTKGAA